MRGLHKQPARNETDPRQLNDIRTKRILFVDDNATNRLVLSMQLRSWHCRGDEAESAEMALQMLERALEEHEPYEIAILDYQMPDMDGEELGRRIKQDPRFRNVHLIMMTSIGKRGDAARFQEIGFAAYMTKPIKQSQLYDCLVSVINGPEDEEGRQQRRGIITRHSLAEEQKQRVRILLAKTTRRTSRWPVGIWPSSATAAMR